MAAGAQDQQGFPLLFFSYAHARWEGLDDQRDADLWVRKFYGNLCTEIELLVDLPRGQDPLFIDRRITLGANWPQVLSEKLSHCAVFVPLYTRNYFQHPDCGREWAVIRQRQDMHIAATKSHPNIIVPVLWDPVHPKELPPWARDIPYVHEELGYAYRTYGLEELMRVKDHEAEYRRAVRFLARRIVEVANAPEKLRPLREIPSFRSLPNEFADQLAPDGESGRVRITVVALDTRTRMPPERSTRWYGSTALDWTPYRDPQDGPGHDTPAVWRASDVARQRDYITEVTELTSRSEELRVNGTPTAPTILLVDPWATLDSSRWALLARLDKITRQKPWIRIIMPWNAADRETLANANVLHGGIETHLGHARSQGRIPSRRGEPGPIDSSAFGLAVSEALRSALAEFLRQSTKYLPAGPLPTKPRLRGPIGMGAPLGHDDGEEPPVSGKGFEVLNRLATGRDVTLVQAYQHDTGTLELGGIGLTSGLSTLGRHPAAVTRVRRQPEPGIAIEVQRLGATSSAVVGTTETIQVAARWSPGVRPPGEDRPSTMDVRLLVFADDLSVSPATCKLSLRPHGLAEVSNFTFTPLRRGTVELRILLYDESLGYPLKECTADLDVAIGSGVSIPS